jgi:hypothetical protein
LAATFFLRAGAAFFLPFAAFFVPFRLLDMVLSLSERSSRSNGSR